MNIKQCQADRRTLRTTNASPRSEFQRVVVSSLAVVALALSAGLVCGQEKPAYWQFLPFSSGGKPAAKQAAKPAAQPSAQPRSQVMGPESPRVASLPKRPNPAPVPVHGVAHGSDISPAAFHGALQPPAAGAAPNSRGIDPFPMPAGTPSGEDLYRQTDEDARRKSWGCVTCHTGVHDMHDLPTVKLGCVDCHGGNADCMTKEGAHVAPKFPQNWPSSANPVRSYTLLNHESPEFVRFVNPGDLRVAHISCGGCHAKEVLQSRKSMMTHGCMLWSAALYNNGAVPYKAARYGESYSMCGTPQRMQTVWKPGQEALMQYEIARKGVVPFLDPLPRYEISQPANILRIFERGGRFQPEVGIPEREEEPGRPRTRLSVRGLGTGNRTDPVFIGLQKTRLLDPTLNFLGTNDKPGDYRSSGCSACHVVYANDRSPVHSGQFAKYGNRGTAAAELDDFVKNIDPTIPKNEPGHPVAHKFSVGMPTSQCIVCHMHPGTTVLQTYIGYMWWDNETDGELMYPEEQKYPTAEEYQESLAFNPEEAAAKGNWSDPEFLTNLTDLNDKTKHTQFGDFHGHGWAFRAVFKKDRKGNLLDHKGDIVTDLSNENLQRAVKIPEKMNIEKKDTLPDYERNNVPVHLMDIHMEKGMHCVDCHFVQDVHGNTKLYGEVRAAIEIQCVDCHGSAGESVPEKVAKHYDQTHRYGGMFTSGPASPPEGRDLLLMRTPHKERKARFEIRNKLVVNEANGQTYTIPTLYQRSMVDPTREWEVVQTADTITPGHPRYSPKSHQAKTVRWENGDLTWGGRPDENDKFGDHNCAHQSKNMSCIACHSSWNPSCFGCHLPQKAAQKAPQLHNEGDVTRNIVRYNFQTLRDDVFMLGRDGLVTGNRIGPARSSCAIHVGSYNNNRESIYVQQQTISGCGLSGIAFSTNVPHTVRGGNRTRLDMAPGSGETKMCSDCHISKNEDNNAIMAQLLMQGTNYTNFIGKYCWVAAGEHGFEAVIVTEQEEPQAVIGSSLHKLAYPDHYEEHVAKGFKLEHAHEHPGMDIIKQLTKPFQKPEILQIQHRGEYLYAACGCDGIRVFDIAFIDDKAFAERITTAPVSPLGQRFYVPSKYCTAIASPSTIAPDPTRQQFPENHEQAVAGMYAYIYATDKYEGLILVGAGTLLDGDPLNNFIERAATFNPNGLLCGAKSITIVGSYAYICCDAGLVVVDIADAKNLRVTKVIDEHELPHPHQVQVQFRYGYVCTEEGLHVLDTTNPAEPHVIGHLPLEDAHSVYLARTYAYVAAGHHGLVIVDITKPAEPFIDQVYNANGCIKDLHDVKLGITYTSEFAYLADGEHGLHVVQLTSPDTHGNAGFSPRPAPQLVATYKLPKGGHALSIAEGVDRDRAVDESGNQIAVFGRLGARPMSLPEQQKMYIRQGAQHGPRQGQLWKVSDHPYDPIYKPVKNGVMSYNDFQRVIEAEAAKQAAYAPAPLPQQPGTYRQATRPGPVRASVYGPPPGIR